MTTEPTDSGSGNSGNPTHHPALKLRGVTEPTPAPPELPASHGVKLSVRAEFRPGASRAARSEDTVDIAPDDIVEIGFVEGPTVWLRGEEYVQRFAGAAAARGTGDGEIAVPATLEVLPRGMRARGPIAWVVKTFKVMGVDLAGHTAAHIATLVEGRRGPNRPGPGLYRCTAATDAFALQAVEATDVPTDRPVLLFIHGTASSTWGSFGDLWSPARRDTLAALGRAYGNRVLAFDYRSLTESPVRNALELARRLPPGARLHLVTHSQGGLVGELLARGTPTGNGDDAPRFSDDELGLFGDEEGRQREELARLAALLAEKRIRVERFVRVACPVLGTTLASERLDRWLSVVGSLAKMALPESPLTETFSDLGGFLAAVLKERTDPATLGGLAAMGPGSTVVRLVNWPRAEVGGQLTVIAGDIEPDQWWARLLVWTTDRFYEGDHDLIVNTASMVGGARRPEGQALQSVHKGPGIHHFAYFRDPGSAGQILRALTRAPEDTVGFEALYPAPVSIPRAVARSAAAGPRPVVFVLPGIMGSELAVRGDRVWLDFVGMLFGGLKKLRMRAAGVEATRPLPDFYGELIENLAGTHEVVDFPFDWRLPLEHAADRLAERVREVYARAGRYNQPVRFLAHSMGGLVVRTLVARHPDLWQALGTHPGSRLLMLGVPSGGSHAITALVVGQLDIVNALSLLDLRHSEKQLLRIITRFPGLLSMLPVDAEEDYFDPGTWEVHHRRAGKDWVLPDAADLGLARAFRESLDAAPVDPARMLYVAGSAPVTPARMVYDEATGRIRFLGTTRGDGRVTWDGGIPPGVRAWYADVAHGRLPAHRPAFAAYQELLETGTTAALPTTAPVARAAAELFPVPARAERLYPDAEGLAAAALGAGPRRLRARRPAAPAVTVRVVHGDLACARHPVAVGHYAGDTLISAEKALDTALDGELAQRHRLGIYPGALGSRAVFVNPRLQTNPWARPRGALVVGLGQVGHLTAANLSTTFSRALLEYVVEWGERFRTGDAPGEGPASLALSTLLIGTGAGGIGITDCVHALLAGVARANETLATARHPQRIGEVELLERWEDRAIQAARALVRLRDEMAGGDAFAVERTLVAARGGARQVTFSEPTGWWDRLQIVVHVVGDRTDRNLRFLSLTRRARNELRLLATQRALVDRLVADSIRSTEANRALSAALYERLLPNELKEQAPTRDNLLLLVDEEAARYPWELLEDPRNQGAPRYASQQGLLRQLATAVFVERPALVSADTALIIGDPAGGSEEGFPELPGAEAEAEAVWRVLQAEGGYHAERLRRPSGTQVMLALYLRPYRVLHLAGHGVYRHQQADAGRCGTCGRELPAMDTTGRAGPGITGMVLGQRMFLTPAEVKQMRAVPELVFINCCHLGRMDAGPEGRRQDYNLIAANLATEFIRMGVRAVVAAGWAVDDAAAATFASTFYQALLRGLPFGEAVLCARRATYTGHPHTNTWGAYQCYGDPDYRLVRGRGDEGPREGQHLVSSSEVEVALAALAPGLNVAAPEALGRARERIGSLERECRRRGWIGQGPVRLALARAWAEVECFDRAVASYGAALKDDPGAVTLKDLEQRANLAARWAVETWRRGEEPESMSPEEAMPTDPAATEVRGALGTVGETPEARIGWAIGEVQGLMSQLGRTVERHALLGSARRRQAWISPKPIHSLEAMAGSYRDAWVLSVKEERPDPYPLLNLVAANVAMGWFPDRESRPEGRKALLGLLRRAESLLPREPAEAAMDNPWSGFMAVDRELLQALVEKTLQKESAAGSGKGGATLAGLEARYREVARLATRREYLSALDQLEFLCTLAERSEEKAAAEAAGPLRSLLERLQGVEGTG